MKILLFRFKEVITSDEIFRAASLLLYALLLLHLSLASRAASAAIAESAMLPAALLGMLFLMALFRYLRPQSVGHGRYPVVAELICAVSAISILSFPDAMPVMPLPWLIGVAGVFPLILEAGLALFLVSAIAAIGYFLNVQLGSTIDQWLPNMIATLFVGLLAVMLSKALSMNLAAMRQARTNDRRFNAIARATRHVFMIADAGFHVKYVNHALLDVVGYSPEELENKDLRPVVHPDDIEEHHKKLRFLRDKRGSRIFSRHRTRHKDGHWVWLETCGYNMLHDAAIDGLVFSIEDITARKEAELRLQEEHALLRAVLDLNPSLIYAKDAEGRFTVSNASFQRQFGYSSEEELQGKTSYDIFSEQSVIGQEQETRRNAHAVHVQDLQVIQSGKPPQDQELQGFWDTETKRWYRTSKYPLRDATGSVTGVLGIARDITDRKEYELKLEHQALHDFLTGLPNRRFLLKKIAELVHADSTRFPCVTMLFCDLDFFKSVNDTFGHEVGDKCLIEITRRAREVLPESDFLARFGGDEFVVLVEAGMGDAVDRANALLRVFTDPLAIGDVVIKIQASIGLARLSDAHKTPSDLIRDADAAMYQAKERGRSRIEIFNSSLQEVTNKRAHMDVALRFALERNEFVVAYQPKVSMLTGEIKGFELLLRWNSPQYGEISPTEFIPVAESSGLVVPIGLWVLEQACLQISAWQQEDRHLGRLTIAVNVSMRQLLQPSFLSDVSEILKRTGVAPHALELEITETSAMANPVHTIETLSRLKKLGLRLALDDFGTGYSSLAYLQKLPIDVLKIDKAFVHGLGKKQGDAEIVRLILALAKTMNLETVAEGVETLEQLAELRMLGCYTAQGYFFSPALSAEEAGDLLEIDTQFMVA